MIKEVNEFGKRTRQNIDTTYDALNDNIKGTNISF